MLSTYQQLISSLGMYVKCKKHLMFKILMCKLKPNFYFECQMSKTISYRTSQIFCFNVLILIAKKLRKIRLNPNDSDIHIFLRKNINYVKYFLLPDFTLPRGLAENTSVCKRRGRVFEAHSKHRE